MWPIHATFRQGVTTLREDKNLPTFILATGWFQSTSFALILVVFVPPLLFLQILLNCGRLRLPQHQ